MKKKPCISILCILFFLIFINLPDRLNAQTEYDFPAGDYWALNAGLGMNPILVEGASFQLIIDPRLWLSPALMVGSKIGINYSAEKDKSKLGNILTFEGQVYMRWNFLRLGDDTAPEYKINIFAQGGLGLISAYRGTNNPFNEVTETRGSVLAEVALGVTYPLTPRWHLEGQVFGGYPHIVGVSVTAGYKFKLPQKIITNTFTNETTKTEYIEVIKTIPPEEIVKRVMITSVEYILFGPDIGKYNIGIDRDAQQLNELIINQTAQVLKDNSNLRVRIEGHANPYTINKSELDELMVLSAMRAEVVSQQLKDKGVNEDQIVMASYGGNRTVTSDWDIRNRNRRVEMILIKVDLDE